MRPGTLFVVGTPIGNLEDVTIRALRILRDVHLIAAEDTRRTAKLLAHYDIRTSVISLREHNETRETPRLLDRLEAGEDIALVSDAGTPVVSDPGARLIRGARERGLTVSPIPGPSAVTAALSASGFPADRFTFMGYPPSSGRDRQEWFAELRREIGTVVFFESPHRVTRTLEDLQTTLVNRPMIIARELTKINETLVNWPNQTGAEKGEFTLIVGPRADEPVLSKLHENQLAAFVGCLANYITIESESAAEIAARAFNLPLSVVRKAVKLDRYARRRAERELDE